MELQLIGKNLAKALSTFHKLVPDIKKESKNPYFKSTYAGLDSILPAIKEPLEKSGIVFTQIPEGDSELITIISHIESGESIWGKFCMKPIKDDPQGRGSCLTYMRRYSLVSMLGLNCEPDDDGNESSQKHHEEPEIMDLVAKKEGVCSFCKKPIFIGDKIKYSTKDRLGYHVICFNRNGQ